MGGVVLRVLAFVLACVLISPVHARDLMTSDGRPVRNVAVMSRLGDGVNIMYVPTFVPVSESKHGFVPIPDWKIDEHVEQRIGLALGGRFTVVPLSAGEVAGRGSDIWGTDDAVENLRKIGPRAELDAYVMIVTAIDSDDIGGAPVPLFGLGFYHRTNMLVKIDAVYSVYDLMILDAKTGREIARQRGRMDGQWNLASKRVDSKLYAGEDKMPSGEQLAGIREEVTSLLDESSDWTLKKLKLVP
jgi:hypothetical protein